MTEKWLGQLQEEKGKGVGWDLLNIILAIGILIIAAIIGDYVIISGLKLMPKLYTYQPVLIGLYMIVSTSVLILLVYLSVKWIEGRGLTSLGLIFDRRTLKSYGKGALVGAIMLVVVVAIVALGGGLSFQVRGIAASQIFPFCLMGIAWMIQGASEEILVRGYLLTRIGVRRGFAMGIIVSSLIFGILHAFNSGSSVIAILNISLTGVFLALYTLREGNLWVVCGWHTAWNFVQGNLLGLSVSGNPIGVTGELIKGTIESRNTLLTGGEFGIEASIANTLVMLAAIIINLFLYTSEQTEEKKEGEKNSEE